MMSRRIIQAAGNKGYSLSFRSANSQRLSMTSVNFGTFNHDQFAISLWYRQNTVSTDRALYVQGDGAAGTTSFFLSLTATNTIDFVVFNASAIEGRQTTTATTFNDTKAFHHILVYYDRSNATSGDRMRMWHDGTEITSFSTDTVPSNSAFTTSIGIQIGAAVSSGFKFNGYIYQPAFFSGSLPAVTSLRNATTGKPKDITGVTGLYSLLKTNGTDNLLDDYILSPNWTNNGSSGGVSKAQLAP